MKGFIYLIEIAIVAIIMTVILSVFFSIRIKQDWERAEIVSIGENILKSIKNNKNSFLNILNENFTDIELSRPQNIMYGLKILGSPKSNIFIGCTSRCGYLDDLLNPSYSYGTVFVNGRWINFTVDSFDIKYGIPYYDVVILVNYTKYYNSTINSYIDDYLKSGGALIGINATQSSTDINFNNTFNLTGGSGPFSSTINFTFYNSSEDEIAKYFFGIGVEAYSNWTIWEQNWTVDYWGTNKINITNSLNPADIRTNLKEGDVFNIQGPDSNLYYFKVKKMWYPQRVEFQILNKTFVFRDFSERNAKGKNIVGYRNYAALTTNNSAVWISDFPTSSEYISLLKAAILSRVDEWTAKYAVTPREKTTLSSFMSLCCDMPETAELYLTLWYQV
jgi:hypothetical protein